MHQVNLVGGALAGLGLLWLRSASSVLQIAATLILGSITLRPALLGMGLQRTLLHAAVVSLAFYGCLLVAVPIMAVSGASLARLVCNGGWLIICMAVFETRVQQAEAAAPALVLESDEDPD